MKFLRDSFLWFLLFSAIGLWVYVDTHKREPCIEPIRLTLGSFDERFNVSRAEFVDIIAQAEATWESALGKNLFEYDPDPKPASRLYTLIGRRFVQGDVVVNLVYDERQQKTEAHQALVSEVNNQKETAENIKQMLELLQKRYERAVVEYRDYVAQYQSRNVSYEIVEAQRLEVNRLADETNMLVKRHNALAGELNSVVRTINQKAGQEFEEGKYVRDETGERIDIYEFANKRVLARVLAHELGHALGLDHNSNPDSIMYYLNDSVNLEPTEDDLVALAAICKAH